MAEPGWTAKADALLITQLAPPRIDILRLRGKIAEQMSAIEESLGVALSEAPNRASGRDPRIISLAPGDWMIVRDANRGTLASNLIDGQLAHMADVTEGQVVFMIAGATARDLLAKGTSLDLHRSVLPQDHCARTLFAQIRVLIDNVGSDCFQLFADISFAPYLRAWFEDAIQEFRHA